MSTLSPKSRANSTSWTICLLAVLILYVLIWPIVDIKCTSVVHSGPGPGTGSVHAITSKPAWLRIIYFPLDAL